MGGIPPHPSRFTGNPSDLEDSVAYERDALEFLRATLWRQSEAADGGMTITLGDVNTSGEFRGDLVLQLEESFSAGAVRNALERFRPLAFSTAFKLQDLTVEWILRANGEAPWRFSDKRDAYNDLRNRGSLMEPPLFSAWPDLSHAFWELYRVFAPYRGAVVHNGGLVMSNNGTMTVTTNRQRLSLTSEDQAAYTSAMCSIAAHLIAGQPLAGYLRTVVENDFARLAGHHRLRRFVLRPARLQWLRVRVPVSLLRNAFPFSVEIDFSMLRRAMERAYSSGSSGHLFFSASIHVEDQAREAVWDLPVEAVPKTPTVLQEGDPVFDRYLRITKKG